MRRWRGVREGATVVPADRAWLRVVALARAVLGPFPAQAMKQPARQIAAAA
jgi:hypothetical protein